MSYLFSLVCCLLLGMLAGSALLKLRRTPLFVWLRFSVIIPFGLLIAIAFHSAQVAIEKHRHRAVPPNPVARHN